MQRPAFTFIELVAVVVILAILAAMAIPRYASFTTQQRLWGAVNRVMADLQLAQRHARLTGTSVIVTFDVAADRYTLDGQGLEHPDRRGAPYVVRLAEPPYAVTIGSADFNGDAQVVFDGYGVADSGGTVVLSVGALTDSVTVSTGSSTNIESQPPQVESS